MWPYMPSRLIQANERKHPKQAIGANDQRPTAGIVVMANDSAVTAGASPKIVETPAFGTLCNFGMESLPLDSYVLAKKMDP